MITLRTDELLRGLAFLPIEQSKLTCNEFRVVYETPRSPSRSGRGVFVEVVI